MLLAILSDSHSSYRNIEQAVKQLHDCAVQYVLHCGDIADVRAAEMFSEFSTWFVLGNVDRSAEAIARAIKESGNQCLGRFGELELAGRRIALLHGDDRRQLREAEQRGRYDLVCYGHTHVAEQHRAGRTLVVNPGAIHRARSKSIALLDLDKMKCQFVPLA